MVGIYKITSPSGKIYIGQSVDIESRMKYYRTSKKRKSQPRLFNSFRKYGFKAHLVEIIIECEESELNDLERYYQDLFDVTGVNGLNCRLTTSDDRSGKLSKETIDKLKKKDVSYMIGNDFRKGISHTDETKKQIRNTLIENAKKPDYINGMTGRFGENNPFFGKKHSNESLKKMSEFQKKANHTHLIEANKKRSFLILDNYTGIFYYSISEASLYLGINKSTLKAYLSGRVKNKTNLIKV